MPRVNRRVRLDRLLGPLMLAGLLSPVVRVWSAESLLLHHLAHWGMMGAGAVMGHQLRHSLRSGHWRHLAWPSLVLALAWHLPPLLDRAEADPRIDLVAHAGLIASGAVLALAIPELGAVNRAAMLITVNVVMWPIVLAEISRALAFAVYPGQGPLVGSVELGLMPLLWLVAGFWAPLRRRIHLTAGIVVGAQVGLGALAAIAWLATP